MGNNLKYLQTGKHSIPALIPVLITALMVLIPSCRNMSYETDISDIEMKLEIKRLEHDLFTVDFDNIPESIPMFYERYGEFFDLFNYRIISIGGARQPTYPDYLKSFLSDYLNHQVYRETVEVFPDVSELERVLCDAFKRYSRHFPGRIVPGVYTFVSRFNQSIVTAEGILAIGLDNYLGTECEFYSRLGKHRYQTLNMHPGKIPSDCMIGWGMTEFEYNDSVDNVLSNMIYNGKMAFFAK